jgi:hypothetical protein
MGFCRNEHPEPCAQSDPQRRRYCNPASYHSFMPSEPKVLFSLDPDSFVPFESITAPIQKCVMPLIAECQGHFKPVGTGFIIHPSGIMMTARHVIAEAQRLAEEHTGVRGAPYGFNALYVSEDKLSETMNVGGLLPINWIRENEAFDIAICKVNLPIHVETGELISTMQTRLSVNIPKPGERILAAGYHDMKMGEVDWSDTAPVCDVAVATAYSTGQVVDIFPERRDAGFLRFPIAQGDARFKYGMSGGPVFNEMGRVFGVVCSSLDDGNQRPYIGYVSMLWPAMLLTLDASLNGQDTRTYQLRELGENGTLDIEGLEHVSVDGVTISYRA